MNKPIESYKLTHDVLEDFIFKYRNSIGWYKNELVLNYFNFRHAFLAENGFATELAREKIVYEYEWSIAYLRLLETEKEYFGLRKYKEVGIAYSDSYKAKRVTHLIFK
ncbi:MAG: hypothetical protein KGO96_06905 [Elusimicrobia bacterium]|nr:hypothetical protein [Elusimicrobiota bacterium]